MTYLAGSGPAYRKADIQDKPTLSVSRYYHDTMIYDTFLGNFSRQTRIVHLRFPLLRLETWRLSISLPQTRLHIYAADLGSYISSDSRTPYREESTCISA